VTRRVPRCRQGQAGKLFVEGVLSARLIDDDEAIPPVAVRQHQPMRAKGRFQRLAVVRLLPAIEDRVADRLEVRLEAASFLEFLSIRRAGLVVRCPLVAHLPE
jgi:hypothetical protein